MTVETSPDWLPPGWTREFRFQKTGRRITQYVNRASGQKFFTKDDLIRYAGMESKQCNDKLPTLRKNKTSSANDQAVTTVEENQHPEWLPKNWLVELKTRKSGVNFGRQYKIYVDPSSGLKFYSEREVLRFLGRAVSSKRNPEQKKRDSRPTKKGVIEKSTDDDLPSGWIKEVRIKRNLYGVRRYPYYTDPVSGYVFRSKTTTLRYLETGEIAKTAFLPKKDNGHQILTDADESLLPPAKRKKVEHLADGPDLNNMLDSNAAADKTEKNEKELDSSQGLSNQLDRLEPKQVADGLELVKPSQSEAIGSCVVDDKSPLRLNVRSDTEVAKQGYDSTEKIINGDILGKQPEKLETEKTSDSKSEVQPLFSSDQGLVSTPASDVLQEKNLGKTRTESKRSNVETKTEELDLPPQFSIPLAGLEHELVGNEAKPPCVLVDKATQQLNVDPNAMQTVGPKIDNIKPHEVFRQQALMSETQKGGDSELEVHHLFCSDPCLDFAIKTLTGAIPLEVAISEGLVLSSLTNAQQQKGLTETRTEHSSCKKTLFNSVGDKKKDVCHLVGHTPEPVANSLSNEQVLDFAAGKIYDSKAVRYVEFTPVNLTAVKSSQHEIGPSKSKEPHKKQTIPAQTNDASNPFGSSWTNWSNSFFESPFNILTSSSSAEDSFAFQTNFAPITGQSVQQQQFPLNPPSITLPKSSTAGAQKSYRKGKKKSPAKAVKSKI